MSVVAGGEGNYRPERKTGKDLYTSFMEQNLDASRILILESALDPVQPGPARIAGASEPGQRAGIDYHGLGNRAPIGVHQYRRAPADHGKTPSENFQGLRDTC
jgi:hypothetical protein